MKHSAIILLTTLLLSSASLSATDTKKEDRVKKEVSKHMHHPGNGVEGVVYANFVINSEGEVEMHDIQSTDLTLQEYVLGKLKDIKLKITDSGEEHRLHFIFKKDQD